MLVNRISETQDDGAVILAPLAHPLTYMVIYSCLKGDGMSPEDELEDKLDEDESLTTCPDTERSVEGLSEFGAQKGESCYPRRNSLLTGR